MIKKKTKKNGKVVFLEKNMLNRIEVLSSKALIDSYISRDEFVLVNNFLKEYDMKEKIKIWKSYTVHQRFQSICKIVLRCCLKCREKNRQ